MRATTNELFSTLADPTRRAIFERLCRDGEQTVRALTDRAGVSQPAVSKHLGVLKQAGLVRDQRLSYSWNASGEESTGGLKTVVTWTLTPTKGGVLVRMEQSGFRPEDEANYQGANYGWQRFIGGLERVAAGLG